MVIFHRRLTLLGRIAAFAAVFCVSSVHAQSVGDNGEALGDAQAIRTLTDTWIEVSANGDVDAYLAMVSEDFLWLGSGSGPGYLGKDEVRQFLEPYFNAYSFSVEDVHSLDVAISSDGTFAVHEWTGIAIAIAKAKDGSSTIRTRRKYYDFWRKSEDGRWECSRHLFLPIE